MSRAFTYVPSRSLNWSIRHLNRWWRRLLYDFLKFGWLSAAADDEQAPSKYFLSFFFFFFSSYHALLWLLSLSLLLLLLFASDKNRVSMARSVYVVHDHHAPAGKERLIASCLVLRIVVFK